MSDAQYTRSREAPLTAWETAWRAVLALGVALVVSNGAFFLARWGLGRLGAHPSPYALAMAMVGVAFALVATWGFLFGRVEFARQRQIWRSLLEGIEQFARGNFQVRIDSGGRHRPRDHPFQELVEGLNTMAADLARLETMRQEFIANVSHELQSPLTAIAGFAQILKAEALTPEARRHYLDIIDTESHRLSRLADNLLQLASLESGQHPVHPEVFSLDRQIRGVVVALEPLWSAKHVDVEVALPPLAAAADPDQINQVWVNVLTNAIKFTPPGGRIRVSAQRAGDRVTVAVRDTGIGVSAADQARIFERFYKADRAHTRTTEGSGLGLAIARRILDLNHGAIALESVPAEGTTVTVSLPAAPRAQA